MTITAHTATEPDRLTPPMLWQRPLLRYRSELRKLLDTRSALAVLMATVGVSLLAIGLIVATEDAAQLDVPLLARNATGLVAYFVPLLAILTITGEWRQRTVLGTYALDPSRTAVLAAKCVALLTVVVVAAVVAVAEAYVTVAALGRPLPSLADALGLLAWMLLAMSGTALVGVGLAAMVLNTPLAMVLYLVAPQLLPQLLAETRALEWAAPYVDIHRPLMGVLHGELPSDAGAFVVSLLLWVVIPIGVGVVRNAHADVR